MFELVVEADEICWLYDVTPRFLGTDEEVATTAEDGFEANIDWLVCTTPPVEYTVVSPDDGIEYKLSCVVNKAEIMERLFTEVDISLWGLVFTSNAVLLSILNVEDLILVVYFDDAANMLLVVDILILELEKGKENDISVETCSVVANIVDTETLEVDETSIFLNEVIWEVALKFDEDVAIVFVKPFVVKSLDMVGIGNRVNLWVDIEVCKLFSTTELVVCITDNEWVVVCDACFSKLFERVKTVLDVV